MIIYRNFERIYHLYFLKAIFWFICLILFIVSFPRTWSLYLLSSWLFFCFLYWNINFKGIIGELSGSYLLILPPVIYFLFQFLSILINGDNIINLESQLMFLLVPLLGFPLFRNDFYLKRNNLLFKSFIFGIISISVILLILTLICIKNRFNPEIGLIENLKSNSNCFFSTEFSRFEHPTYLGMKIIWSIIVIMFLYKDTVNKLFLGLIIAYYTLIIFLLASKASIIMLTILFIIFLLYYINKSIKESFLKYLTFIIISLILLVSSFGIAREITRINMFLNELERGFSQPEVDWKNLDQRTREWYCAFQLIKEKPILGHGIGRVEDRMVEEYLKNGWVEEARLRLNAHNQFLETQMTFGIPGTLTLLWMLLTPLIFRKRLQYPELATAFVFMMTFFLMFESMFVRQWGIMFFTLFYCILVIPSKGKNSVQLNHLVLKNK